MIKQIQEINFPSYATLHQATVSLAEMGERTITTQVRIDGDVEPDFEGWELVFKGEHFVLPVREPQATKDNSSRNSIIDLTFQSWPIDQMKRFFFMEMASIEAGTYIPDRYVASVSVTLSSFVDLLNQVLEYYFGGKILAVLNSGIDNGEKVNLTIEHSHIWDVITKIYESFNVRWNLEYQSAYDRYLINIGFPVAKIEDHDFEYGFEGGLLKFERQVQDSDIANILLGRGGEKNLPYRYFKKQDPQNPLWTPDPDAVPELANIYFDRLRDANFRRYVQGWITNENYVQQEGYPAPREYDAERGEYDFAYKMGHFAEKFDPVEYVKDDASIAKYGERWGYVDNDDDIYPTIQGVIMDNYGRIDEVVAVSPILTDDISTASRASSEIIAVDGITSLTTALASTSTVTKHFYGGKFSVPVGQTANLIVGDMFVSTKPRGLANLIAIESYNVSVFDDDNEGVEVPPDGIVAGNYHYEIEITIRNLNSFDVNDVTYGAKSISLQMAWQEEAWKPTFDIWIKNIFGTSQAADETPEDYARRVWEPILGDRTGGDAQIAFSDGFMSISEDYNFVIAKYPELDQSKSFGGYLSEWKITLRKSDAEFDATGLFIPNSKTGGAPIAGDHFFFLGIDMPHALVEAAEEKLNATKTAKLDDTSAISPTWVVSLDKVRITQKDTGYIQTLFDRIGVGTELRIKDPRFTGGNVLQLIVKSITYTWDEPSDDDPKITPEIEVVLSTEDEPGGSAIQQLEADIKAVRQSSVQIADIENIIKRVAGPLFLRKSGESDTSFSPTRFANRVSSEDFESGNTEGSGWGAYRNADGKTILEADRMIVREDLQVNSIVANQIAYVGGKRITSAAAMECILVEEVSGEGGYICYFDQKQGSVKNLFQVGDIAMGQTFSPEWNEVRFYKNEVIGVTENSIILADSGGSAPQKGDIIVQYGNTSVPSRQFVIVEDVIGGGYIKMIGELNSINTNGKTYFFAGSEYGDEELKDSLGNSMYDKNGEQLFVKKNQARLFIGDEDSNIEYSQRTKRFTVKGTIVQSPSGSEFPIPCARGEYSASTTYYKGDMVTYQGRSWIRVSSTAASGDTPAVGNWMIYAERGEQGNAGASPLFRGVWSNTGAYYGDQYRIDIVRYVNLYYRALTTAGTIPAGTLPTNTQYWAPFGANFESVATGLLVAENATIENAIITKLRTAPSGARIEAFDNYMTMTDADGKQRLIVTGDDVDIVNASVIVYPSTIVHHTPTTRYQVTAPDEEFDLDFFDVIATFTAGNNSTITIPAISFAGGLSNADIGESDDAYAGISSGYLKLQRLAGSNWLDVSTLMGPEAAMAEDENYTPYSFQSQAQSIVVNNAAQYRVIFSYHIKLQTLNWGTTAYVELSGSAGSGKIVITDNEQKVSIGANGFSASLGNDFMMNCAKDTENNDARIIEMRGKDSGGNVMGIRLSSAGMEFIFGSDTYKASYSGGYLALTRTN